jgi:hypothetical protein
MGVAKHQHQRGVSGPTSGGGEIKGWIAILCKRSGAQEISRDILVGFRQGISEALQGIGVTNKKI